MYAQQNDEIQNFRRGEHIIPANYAGNAFTLDEEPCVEEMEPLQPSADVAPCPPDSPQYDKEPKLPSTAPCENDCYVLREKKQERGLLSDLFSRFSRKFELDDILLIGLIILLLQNDCGGRDETVILLALLLLSGF